MTITLDVSAAFPIVTAMEGKQWVAEHLRKADEVLAPDLYISEASTTAWKFFHIDGGSLEDIHLLAKRAMELPDQIIPAADLWQDALELAHELNHPVYDCLYLSLARQRGAALLTLDRELIRKANGLGIDIATE